MPPKWKLSSVLNKSVARPLIRSRIVGCLAVMSGNCISNLENNDFQSQEQSTPGKASSSLDSNDELLVYH